MSGEKNDDRERRLEVRERELEGKGAVREEGEGDQKRV